MRPTSTTPPSWSLPCSSLMGFFCCVSVFAFPCLFYVFSFLLLPFFFFSSRIPPLLVVLFSFPTSLCSRVVYLSLLLLLRSSYLSGVTPCVVTQLRILLCPSCMNPLSTYYPVVIALSSPFVSDGALGTMFFSHDPLSLHFPVYVLFSLSCLLQFLVTYASVASVRLLIVVVLLCAFAIPSP